MEDQEQSFTARILETLQHQSGEIAQQWTSRVQPSAGLSEREAANSSRVSSSTAEQVVRALLETTGGNGTRQDDPVIEAGWTMGVQTHCQTASLQLLLKEIDALTSTLLEASERAAEHVGSGTAREGLALAHQIDDGISRLRLAATRGYTQLVEDELRARYRTIRHDLRNPLSTIRSAVSLLTDDTLPPEMRESSHVRAMVVRNARSLDQMIGAALGDAAARLPAFAAPRDRLSADVLPADMAPSDRQQRDNVTRTGQRTDLESGTF